MSNVEAPFIIAVIREKEKSLLGDNEITRMMHAASLHDAREVLMSTPYALFLAQGAAVQDALMSALEAEFLWLKSHLDNKSILAFIGARYDVLHVAQGIIALASGQINIPTTTHIDTLTHHTIQEMIFLEGYIPTKDTLFWHKHIAVQKEAIKNGTWSMPYLFESMEQVVEERLATLATTPFMKSLATHVREQHQSDRAFREHAETVDVSRYEREWDAKIIALAKTLRFEPIGYDPIIAYWVTKEMEIKTIRLMFASLANGFSKEEILTLVRPFAHV